MNTMNHNASEKQQVFIMKTLQIKFAWVVIVVLMATISVGAQVFQYGDTNANRLDYLRINQLERHQAVLEQRAGDTWSYRVLSAWLVEGWLKLLKWVQVEDVALGFISFRLLQNALLFALLIHWYGVLGFRDDLIVLALTILVWAISHSNYGSDLSFNTYFDVIFYVVGMIALHANAVIWFVPLTLVAALNRETSALLPLLPLVLLGTGLPRQKIGVVVITSGGIFALVYAGLRVWIGDVPISADHSMWDLLTKNLTRPLPLFLILLTYGAIPFLALWYWRDWSSWLKRVGILVLPTWLGIHLLISRIAETRLFLVPFVIVILPALLYGLQSRRTQHS